MSFALMSTSVASIPVFLTFSLTVRVSTIKSDALMVNKIMLREQVFRNVCFWTFFTLIFLRGTMH